MMKVRIITSALGIALFLALLAAPPFAIRAVVPVLCLVAIYELYKAVGIIKIKPLAASGIFGAILCALMGRSLTAESADLSKLLFLMIALYIGVLFALMIRFHGSVTTSAAATAFFGAMFPAICYSYLLALRGNSVNGEYLIIILFAATWAADGGAYFAGLNFGKTPLAPRLSPKKTVEGAVGGVFGSVIAMAICYGVFTFIFKAQCSAPLMLITGALCAILGPVGDIATSAVKREHNIKDFGTIFPGHGGVLDRFDSVLMTAPIVFYMNEIFGLIK